MHWKLVILINKEIWYPSPLILMSLSIFVPRVTFSNFNFPLLQNCNESLFSEGFIKRKIIESFLYVKDFINSILC